MHEAIVPVIVAAVSGGALTWFAQKIIDGVARILAARREHETRLQRAERIAYQWELVARSSRCLAAEHGVALEDLPLGPGESHADIGEGEGTR